MLLRFIVLCGCAFALAGCHTIDAVHRALENPKVAVTLNGENADYLAVPVTGEELDRTIVEYPMPTVVRFLTGFPPRSFLRLAPR
jgi:hypothetical protein